MPRSQAAPPCAPLFEPASLCSPHFALPAGAMTSLAVFRPRLQLSKDSINVSLDAADLATGHDRARSRAIEARWAGRQAVATQDPRVFGCPCFAPRCIRLHAFLDHRRGWRGWVGLCARAHCLLPKRLCICKRLPAQLKLHAHLLLCAHAQGAALRTKCNPFLPAAHAGRSPLPPPVYAYAGVAPAC